MHGAYLHTCILHLVGYISCTAGYVLSLAGYVPSFGGIVWSSGGDEQSPEGDVGHMEPVRGPAMSPEGHSCAGVLRGMYQAIGVVS
jgi:hypothetical protein